MAGPLHYDIHGNARREGVTNKRLAPLVSAYKRILGVYRIDALGTSVSRYPDRLVESGLGTI